MVEHRAKFTLASHITKLFPQGWDWHLLHTLHPDIYGSPSLLYFLKRTIRDIRIVFTDKSRPFHNIPVPVKKNIAVLPRDKTIGFSLKGRDKEEKRFFNGTFSDKISFSFLSIITNFFLWLGKYWVALALLEARED
ncbi:MAG: hypothetical protein AABZ57_04790 [Candidatus Margulisiibacteriota bacterium]